MAAKESSPQNDSVNGYTCEFKNTIPDDCLCQKCLHVARESSLTSCCGDHFCKSCVSPYHLNKLPCPSCGDAEFDLMVDRREQRRIQALLVYCHAKSRGCEWIGPLEQLDSHVKLESDGCLYIDVQCPSNCSQEVEKRHLKDHLIQTCPLRDFTCCYCNFKASFKVVTKDHWPECLYYPVQCPNRCGVTCERDVLKEHISFCRNQELFCCFRYAGCEEKFIRDDEEKHMEDYAKKHLSLLASASNKMSTELDKLVSENEKIRMEEVNTRKHLSLLEATVVKNSSDLKAVVQENKDLKCELDEKERKIAETEAKCQHLERILEDNELKQVMKFQDIQDQICELQYNTGHAHWIPVTFTMPYFNHLKQSERSWYSPMAETHFGGYKFLIVVRPSGRRSGGGTHIAVYFKAKPGDGDKNLAWPAKVAITIQLLNQHMNKGHITRRAEYNYDQCMTAMPHSVGVIDSEFISHKDLGWNGETETQYLKNDCLKFRITKVEVFS